jgi:tRNA pseudouridine55 synthase
MTDVLPRRSTKVVVDGLFLLNKPAGITSNQALQKVRRLFNAKKAGHTGSLDPAATGMLPLCFGEATKVCAYLLDADKTYRVTARLGQSTDTGDADGQVVASSAVPEKSAEEWTEILNRFLGDIQQVPPMYSALKKDGKRLYEIARSGQVVDRDARRVRIHSIELIEIFGQRLAFRVCCSKGTYVRTLVEDIAKAAGTLAHTEKLHRERVGEFMPEDMLDLPTSEKLANESMEQIRKHLLPVDSALAAWPRVRIVAAEAERFCNGQKIRVDLGHGGKSGLVRVYEDGGLFVGIGHIDDDGELAPKRIFR